MIDPDPLTPPDAWPDDPPARRWSERLDFLTPALGGVGLPWWRWWRRWIHRRSDVASGPGAPAQWAAGPVAGLAVTSEREPGPWIDCVSCSGVTVVENGGRETTPHLDDAHRIRSGAGLPHSGGMTTGDLVRGVKAAYGIDLVRVPRNKEAIRDKLGSGWSLAVFHVYGQLPSHFQRWDTGFDGNHCAAIAGRNGQLAGWYDPLATQGYAGEWIDLDDLLAATFDDLYGMAPGAAGGGSPMAIGTKGLTLTTSHSLKLPDNAAITDYPGGGTVLGHASGSHDYFGGSGASKAVRFDPGSGSVIGYYTGGAGPYKKPPFAFVGSDGFGATSAMSIDLAAGTPWSYLNGEAGGTLAADAAVDCLGLYGATAGAYIVRLGIGSAYADGQVRDTLVQVATANAPYPKVTPPDPDQPPGGDYDAGYAAGSADQWHLWADGLGVPDPPA